MDEQNKALEIKELTPEETEIVITLSDEPGHFDYARIGPKGYAVHKKYEKHAADIYNMELRDGDIFVAGYLRSGTTWTQELVWLVANNLDFKTAAAVPLTHRYQFLEFETFFSDEVLRNTLETGGNTEAVKHILDHMKNPAVKILPSLPSPRFVKTHLPMSLLPPKLLDTAKVVYVARDPRDVVVSCYHNAKWFGLLRFKATFKELWNAFLNDLYIDTPYFEQVKEAWALRNHPNMLFLFYEELSQDLPAVIRRVSNFLGKELTPEQTERLCNHLYIDNFKNNASVNFKSIPFSNTGEKFIRKGKSGGWREYFDEDMQRDAERWIADNLRDTDLRYPGINL